MAHHPEARGQPIHAITLDSIAGMQSLDTIYSDQAVELLLRVTSITGSSAQTTGLWNSLHVYSPTGAHWTTTVGGYTEGITDDMMDALSVVPFGTDGSGVDTVQFWAEAGGNTCGLPSDFDEVSLRLTVGPIDSQYVGHSICLDSGISRIFPFWRWRLGACDVVSAEVLPSWDGPHCFTVARRPCLLDLTGDVNVDGIVSSADIIRIVHYVFKSGAAPEPCPAASDVDCSASVTSADVVVLVNHIFKSGPAPCNVCGLIWDGTWACP